LLEQQPSDSNWLIVAKMWDMILLGKSKLRLLAKTHTNRPCRSPLLAPALMGPNSQCQCRGIHNKKPTHHATGTCIWC
jgi:hypothetical protein